VGKLPIVFSQALNCHLNFGGPLSRLDALAVGRRSGGVREHQLRAAPCLNTID
jgi:hypothetical protein